MNDLFTDERKRKDAERIREKIIEKKPLAILVGSGNQNSAQLYTDLQAIRDYLLEFHARCVLHVWSTLVITYNSLQH